MASVPKPNVDLLDRTLEEVAKASQRKKLRWDQGVYRRRKGCGTAMCFAGWAIHLDGGTWAAEKYPGIEDEEAVVATHGDRHIRVIDGHRLVRPFESARRRLGLTMTEALDLFAPQNSLRDLRRIVAQIKKRATKR